MSRVRLLAAGLAAVAISGSVAGAAEACTRTNAEPDQASRQAIAYVTLCLMDAERRGRGLTPLRLDRKLSAAARRHSRDMVRRHYFSHTAPGGSSLVHRVRRSGYLHAANRWRLGENLAWGSPGESSPQATVRAWLRSPPHRRAMLTPSYRDAGIGAVSGVPHPEPGRRGHLDRRFGVKR